MRILPFNVVQHTADELTQPAQIVSGLRNFVSLDDMRGRRVVVLANLKPAKLCALLQLSALVSKELLTWLSADAVHAEHHEHLCMSHAWHVLMHCCVVVHRVGILSAGMVLCSSNEDHTAVDPISPPEGAAIGERITFEGHEGVESRYACSCVLLLQASHPCS